MFSKIQASVNKDEEQQKAKASPDSNSKKEIKSALTPKEDFEPILIESKAQLIQQMDMWEEDSYSYYGSNVYRKSVEIVFERYNLKDLPYADEPMLDPEKNPALKKEKIKRDLCSRLAFRGEERDIKTIYEAGGFHPSYALGEAKHKDANSQHPFDVIDHRDRSEGSGFISTTNHIRLAYVFACIHIAGTGLEDKPVSQNKFTVYALKAEGAMGPSKNKQEYSVPGGIDKDKILGYRDCELIEVSNGKRKYTKSYYIKGGNVFFRNDIKPKREIVESFLFKDESISTKQDAEKCAEFAPKRRKL